jgi:hypothetical protein
MINEETMFLKTILRAIDGGNFEEWFAGLPEQTHNGKPVRNYYVGESLVTQELILAVKANPEFYRAALFPELGGLQIETT